MTSAVGFAVGRDDQMGSPVGRGLAGEDGVLLARVAMALLGDQAAVERALERVAREAAEKPTAGDEPARRAWLLGLVRVACAAQLSKLPVRSAPRTNDTGAPPRTERDAPSEPLLARRTLARLRPTEREAIVLHLVGGLDVTGVARACGVEESVARGRIASAVSQLLEEEGR